MENYWRGEKMNNAIKVYTKKIKQFGPIESLEYIKVNTDIKQINKVVDQLFTNPLTKRALLYKAFPNNIDEMNTNLKYSYDLRNFSKDLLWHSRVFNKIHNTINEILIYKRNIFKYIFIDELQQAQELLNELEKKYGISLWIIETQLKILQELYGLTEQKEYVSKLLDSETVPDLYKVLARYLSIKAEENVTPSKYEKEVHKMIDELSNGEINSVLGIYLSNKLSYKYVDTKDIGILLAIDSKLTMMDRYDSFIKVLIAYLKNNETDELLIQEIYENIKVINDLDLKNLLLPYLNECQLSDFPIKKEIIEIFDNYTVGDYEKTVTLSEELLKKTPWCIDVYEVYIKSLVYTKRDSKIASNGLINEIIQLFQILYKQEENNIDYLDGIKKISYDYSLNVWAWKLIAMVFQTKLNMKDLKENGRISDGYKFYWLLKPYVMNNIYPKAHVSKLLKYRFKDVDSITQKLHQAFLNKDTNLIQKMNFSNERKNKYQAIIYQQQGNYREALACYENIPINKTRLSKFEILVEKINIHQYLQEYEKSIQLIVDSSIHDFNIIDDVDLKGILEQLETLEKDTYNINYPIVYELYTKYVGAEKEELRSDILEDFLSSYNVDLVSNFETKDFELFDRKKLIYFLKEVCSIDVLSKVCNILTEHEAEEERIAICNLLSEIDVNNIEEYNEEIKEITRIKRIKTFKRVIETSKIYVDETGLKNLLKRSLKENYTRFETFENNDRKRAEKVYNFEMDTVIITMPIDEKLDIFKNMITEIRDQFVFSKEYGLDGYLSVGIRHGTLVGHLRGAIENSKLITIKDSKDEMYLPNKYWLEKMSFKDSLNEDKLSKVFEIFSTNFDSLVESLKEKKVQIMTELDKEKQTYFDYCIDSKQIDSLYVSLMLEKSKNEMSLEKFIDQVISYLWSRTERNLNRIKSYINTDFVGEISSYFDELLKSIEEIEVNNNEGILDLKHKIIETKTNMAHEIEEVSSWFNRSEGLNIKEFEIELAYEIGLEVASKINTGKSIKVNFKQFDSKSIEGKKLRGFVDIFVIIFDNIFKRSGLTNDIPVEVKFIEQQGEVLLECKNKICLKTESLELRLANIEKNKRKLKESEYSLVNREGGSGLSKLRKIAEIDFGYSTSKVDYNIKDEEFILSIIMQK